MKKIAYALFLALLSSAACADDGIDGVWKSHTKDKVRIVPCDTSHCMTIVSGKYAGKTLGKLTLSKGLYIGQVIAPENSESFEIDATLANKTLTIHLLSTGDDKTLIWSKE